jgi:hypothetical protein
VEGERLHQLCYRFSGTSRVFIQNSLESRMEIRQELDLLTALYVITSDEANKITNKETSSKIFRIRKNM